MDAATHIVEITRAGPVYSAVAGGATVGELWDRLAAGAASLLVRQGVEGGGGAVLVAIATRVRGHLPAGPAGPLLERLRALLADADGERPALPDSTTLYGITDPPSGGGLVSSILPAAERSAPFGASLAQKLCVTRSHTRFASLCAREGALLAARPSGASPQPLRLRPSESPLLALALAAADEAVAALAHAPARE